MFGSENCTKMWWDKLTHIGPPVGYHPNAGKTWLVVKPEHKEEAIRLFEGSGIRITDNALYMEEAIGGQRYFGAALGSRSFIEQYVSYKVKTWISEVEELCKIAKIEPQLAYSAYTTGLCKR